MYVRRVTLFWGLLVSISLTANAAERETLSFGQAAPPATEVESFLFPEAECENATYQCLAVRPTMDRSIGVDIHFNIGSAELTPQSRAQLEGVGKVLAARSATLNPGEIVIEGHTDARGTAEYNKRLSERRAESVVGHLVKVHGVKPSVLRPVGRGKEQLKDPSRPDDQANRRVEMVRKAN